MDESKKMYNEANEKLYLKGFYVANMKGCHNDKYEIYNGEGETVMDYLSLGQLVQLADLL